MRLTDAKKRKDQAEFEAWAMNLKNVTLGNSTVTNTDPDTGLETTTVVFHILTVEEQRSMAAASYNERLSQAGATLFRFHTFYGIRTVLCPTLRFACSYPVAVQ